MAIPAPSRRNATVKGRVHKTKLIPFLGRRTPIILQDVNGPCPLIAICNALLLRNILKLDPSTAEVSQDELVRLVTQQLLDSNSNIKNKDAAYVKNQQQNIVDAIDRLPYLKTGIDVNIKFSSIKSFEFTRECAIFDLLDISLYHGWIVDPQDRNTSVAIGSKSYNVLMSELVARGPLTPQQRKVQEFLNSSATQLTNYGLSCLQRGLKERELCVFFRNNHFSTMFKYEGQLYLLASDEVFLNEPDYAWEKFNKVNGDTMYVSGDFK
ncbi:hypothetical protein EUGRSUZ_D01936 [Eucalyptus grandis]|uniref:MINDY deubiquitinase domain-containing protein n=3 Tax=Eucalyptus grandis TaxID=71139 RepID=A0A059CHB0_EUCGR|nr:hypothetical protein EUGRSUZ_D01936 [Eucalyptus grandis]KAK3434459.1 hypothetical protein EUGRSUZ_D01936 [Eucalyptus grandis]